MPPNYENIPQELKERPNWVCWQEETRDGKPTKVPYSPSTKERAATDNPATWGTFEQASEVARTNGFRGIGYVFSKNDPFTGIDLDKCRDPETGKLGPKAQAVVDRLASYSEASPSKTGAHIIVKATLPPNGRRKGKVEMYDTGRYFTVSGLHLEGTPTTIESRQAELEALHGEIFGKPKGEPKAAPPNSTGGVPEGSCGLSDDALIDRIRKSKNGQKFDHFMSFTDLEDLLFRYTFPSTSEADFSLCTMLAFWTRKDAAQMDRIFRRSPLMREKWDESRGGKTYGDWTIAKAIAGTTKTYEGGKRKNQGKKKQNNTFKKDTSQSVNLIDKLNKKHAVIMIGGKCLIMNEVTDPVFNRPDVTFSSINDFKNRYCNRSVMVAQENGMSKVAISKCWLESLDRREYDGIVFSPAKDVQGFYNLYRGFAVTPIKGDWSLFRQFMFEVIAAGIEENFKYLKRWMARLAKYPGGERLGVSIVMRGKMGVGKGVFSTQYGEIFGSHFLHITNPTHLVGKFNNHLKDALLVFVDEGNWAGDKTAEGVLKAMITEKHLMVEPKGKDSFPVKNHIHLIFASNNSWVVPAGLEERRFFVLDVSDSHMQDYKYFSAIVDQMSNGGREALLYDLLEMDVSDDDLRKIPRTDALLDQIIYTMPTAHKFWLERLRAGTLLKDHHRWEAFVITEDLHKQYLEFAQALGDRNGLIDTQFSKELRRLCPDIKRCKRTVAPGRERYVLLFPALDLCRKVFEKVVQIKINWESEES